MGLKNFCGGGMIFYRDWYIMIGYGGDNMEDMVDIDFELAFKVAKKHIEEGDRLVEDNKAIVNLSRAYIALLRGYDNNRMVEV